MRFTDTIMAIPPLLLIIVFVSVVGPSIVLGHRRHRPARLAGDVPARPRPAPRAARVGVHHGRPRRRRARTGRSCSGTCCPNILGPLTVVATFGVATAVLLESSLSFLGLGVRPPEASWGNLITEAVSPVVLTQLPWQWVPAAIAITATVLAVNFIGDGLRDAIDPRAAKGR